MLSIRHTFAGQVNQVAQHFAKGVAACVCQGFKLCAHILGDVRLGLFGALISSCHHSSLNRKATSRASMANAAQGINLRMACWSEFHGWTRRCGFTAAGGKGAHAAAFSGWRLAMTDHCTSGRRSSQRTPVRASMRGQYSAGICRSPSRQKMTDCGGTLMPFARRCALPAASIAISIGFMPAILHL